ncbi:MAG TPA: transcription termination factor Rho, partial [Opitutaceae bacterium]
MHKNPASTPSAETAPASQPANATATTTPAPAEKPENVVRVEGILDIDPQKGGNGQLLDISKFGKRRPSDPFVPKELIRRFKLKTGSVITGTAYPAEGKFPNPKIKFIETVDGLSIEERRAKHEFTALTSLSPHEQLKMELKDGRLTTRAVDL